MKRVIGLVFMCGAASFVSAAAAPTAPSHDPKPVAPVHTVSRQQLTITQLAPADEYFGPLRQSIIGIRNTIRDLGLRYDVNHDIPSQTIASAQLTERSIRDWEKRYPHDSQLPRAVYLLQRLYTKVLSQDSRDRARATANWLFVDFNGSPQAKQLKKVLASEHLPDLPPPTPAPTPTYESIFGSRYPTDFGQSPAPVASMTTRPSSRSSATPLPAPSPLSTPTSTRTPVPEASGTPPSENRAVPSARPSSQAPPTLSP